MDGPVMNQKLEYIERQLSELQLIRCSLLPDEHFTLLDSGSHVPNDLDYNGNDSGFNFWQKALESYAEYELSAFLGSINLDLAAESPASFELKVDGANIWFQVTLPSAKLTIPDEEDDSEPEAYVDQFPAVAVSVKGQNITRAEQEKWQGVIVEKTKEIYGSEYVPYLNSPLIVQVIEF